MRRSLAAALFFAAVSTQAAAPDPPQSRAPEDFLAQTWTLLNELRGAFPRQVWVTLLEAKSNLDFRLKGYGYKLSGISEFDDNLRKLSGVSSLCYGSQGNRCFLKGTPRYYNFDMALRFKMPRTSIQPIGSQLKWLRSCVPNWIRIEKFILRQKKKAETRNGPNLGIEVELQPMDKATLRAMDARIQGLGERAPDFELRLVEAEKSQDGPARWEIYWETTFNQFMSD